MKKLELNQMEGLEGGIDCYLAGAGLLLGAAGLGLVTGGIGIALWGASMGLNIVGMMRSCT